MKSQEKDNSIFDATEYKLLVQQNERDQKKLLEKERKLANLYKRASKQKLHDRKKKEFEEKVAKLKRD
jgi:hypothetical protein